VREIRRVRAYRSGSASAAVLGLLLEVQGSVGNSESAERGKICWLRGNIGGLVYREVEKGEADEEVGLVCFGCNRERDEGKMEVRRGVGLWLLLGLSRYG
jgi:hypothetical protein